MVRDHCRASLAKSGAGLAYTADLIVASELSAGTLHSVLRPYLPTIKGLYLYFPSRSQMQPKLRAFIDFVARRRKRVGQNEERPVVNSSQGNS